MDAKASGTTGGPLYSLQVVRGIAAAAVLLHHTCHAVYLYADPSGIVKPATATFPEWLAIGVDMFFVLSGFIMAHISGPYLAGSRSVGEFAVMRIIRIYPMYFVATMILILVSAVSILLLHGSGNGLNLNRVVASLLYFPTFNDKHLVQPILGVGWTLSYEILFYMVFAACLVVARTLVFLVVSLAVALIVILAIGHFLYDPSLAFSVFLADGIVLEFVFGSFIALAYRTGRLTRAPVVVFVALWGASFLLSWQFDAASPLRSATWGAFAAATIALVVRLEAVGSGWWPRFLVIGGDASYSMYLFHIIVLYLVAVPILHRVAPASGLGRLIAAGVTWIGLIVSTTLIHFGLERPVHTYLLGLFRRKSVAIELGQRLAK